MYNNFRFKSNYFPHASHIVTTEPRVPLFWKHLGEILQHDIEEYIY